MSQVSCWDLFPFDPAVDLFIKLVKSPAQFGIVPGFLRDDLREAGP
jgi:hypothetical protein